jgi:hypothetical protein
MDCFEYNTTYLYKGQEYEMSELFFDVPCYYGQELNPDSRSVNEKYRFTADVYLKDKIIKFIKQPPKDSYIAAEWKEYEESSIEYASLKYVYKRHIKSHHEYARKLDELFVSKKFSETCYRDFNKEFKKYKRSQNRDSDI